MSLDNMKIHVIDKTKLNIEYLNKIWNDYEIMEFGINEII